MRITGYLLSSRSGLILMLGVLLSNVGCVIPSPNGWALNRAGIRQYSRGHYAQARNRFARALKYDPCNSDYRHNLAMAIQKQGDVTASEQILRHNLTLNAMHQPTYHSLAQLMVSQGRAPEAQELVSSWAATQPYVPESNIELAWLQRENGDVASAEQSLQTALRADPSNPVALAHLGQLYEGAGRNDQAVAFYQRSLASNWNQPEVQSRMATLVEPQRMSRSAMMQNQMAPAMLAGGPMMGGPMFAGAPMMSGGMVAGAPFMGDSMMASTPVMSGSIAAAPMDSPTPIAASMPIATEANAVPLNEPISLSEARRQRRLFRKEMNSGLAMNDPAAGTAGWVPSTTVNSTAIAQLSMPQISDSITTPYMSASMSPTPIAQVDPAHASDITSDMTAALPVVDPH